MGLGRQAVDQRFDHQNADHFAITDQINGMT